MFRLASADAVDKLRRDDRGGASVEFVVVAVMLFTILFTMFESGVLMARSVMLERGLNIGVRDIRIGAIGPDDHNLLRERICDGAFLIGDCENSINLEVVPFASAGAFVGGNPFVAPTQCRDRSVPPPETNPNFNAGNPNAIMFVRACLVVDPFFPGLGLGASMTKDATGGYAIVKQTVFMREPS